MVRHRAPPACSPARGPGGPMLFHLTIIFGCQLAGETLVRLFALPLPGPVLGMALLFAGLLVFGLPDDFRRTGEV
ncbi:MAG: CidA/LrgA family protein, partial [Pseudomonadota bacterium]